VTTKIHQRTRPRSRIQVHVGQLERTLEQFNEELGRKTAMSIALYDGRSVKPLRQRLDWLEKPLVVRAWLRTVQGVKWLAKRLKREPESATPASEAPTAVVPPPAAAKPVEPEKPKA